MGVVGFSSMKALWIIIIKRRRGEWRRITKKGKKKVRILINKLIKTYEQILYTSSLRLLQEGYYIPSGKEFTCSIISEVVIMSL